MNMRKAEARLQVIIPEGMTFCLDFTRWHHAHNGERSPARIRTECGVWLAGSVNKHIQEGNWQLAVDRVAQMFADPIAEIPDLGYGDEGEGLTV